MMRSNQPAKKIGNFADTTIYIDKSANVKTAKNVFTPIGTSSRISTNSAVVVNGFQNLDKFAKGRQIFVWTQDYSLGGGGKTSLSAAAVLVLTYLLTQTATCWSQPQQNINTQSLVSFWFLVIHTTWLLVNACKWITLLWFVILMTLDICGSAGQISGNAALSLAPQDRCFIFHVFILWPNMFAQRRLKW